MSTAPHRFKSAEKLYKRSYVTLAGRVSWKSMLLKKSPSVVELDLEHLEQPAFNVSSSSTVDPRQGFGDLLRQQRQVGFDP